MEFIKNLVEYFDELHPITESAEGFYKKILNEQPKPTRILSIGTNTGNLEFFLAKQGCDVTGIENFPPLLEAANLKKQNELTPIRFFSLPENELSKYLGKKFYNIINVVENRICYNSNQQKLRTFFKDLNEIVAENGTVVLRFFNFGLLSENKLIELPAKSSSNAELFTTISETNGKTTITKRMKTCDGKEFAILQDVEIYPLKKDEINQFSKEAGFRKTDFFADFEMNPFSEKSAEIIAVLQ